MRAKGRVSLRAEKWERLVRGGAVAAVAGGIALAGLASPIGCVTLNVNVKFPESVVQKATDDYVRELYRAKQKKDASAPAAADEGAWNLDWMWIASARADDTTIEFKVNTPKAMTLQKKLAGRVGEVIKFKKDGVLGETSNGMLELKGADKVKKLLLMKVEKLVKDENADRSQLYAEIVAANGLTGETADQVQRSFARSFQAESPSGTWVQSTEGDWAQKP